MAGKLSIDATILSHLGYLLFVFVFHICFSLWDSPADQTDCPLSTQIKYVLTSVKSHLFQKIWLSAGLSGCHWENQVVYMWVWIKCMQRPVYLRVNQVSLLQRPVASIHAVRRVGSSHCGTNVWLAGRSTKSGEEPTSGSQQQKDSEWVLFTVALSAQLCSVEPS